MVLPSINRTYLRWLAWAFLGGALIWGARITVMEGFVLEWPLRFAGDFATLMYKNTEQYWDGKEIAYGPVFVVEFWLTHWKPQFFTIFFYALANIFLVLATFVFCVRASRSNKLGILMSLAAWLCFRRLYYSFSIAANPEFLELFFLSWAWYSISRESERSEGVLVAAAAMTKVVPWVFTAPLVLRKSFRGILALVIVSVTTYGVIGYIQNMSIGRVLMQVVLPHPYNDRSATSFVGAPETSMSTGFVDSYLRIFCHGLQRLHSAEDVKRAQFFYVFTILISLALTGWATLQVVYRKTTEYGRPRWGLIYGMFFALLPLLTVMAHPHTFLFLLPVWTIVIDQLLRDCRSLRFRLVYWAGLGVTYVCTGFPQALSVVDRLLKTSLLHSWIEIDPIVGSLMLLVLLWSYIGGLENRNGIMRQ